MMGKVLETLVDGLAGCPYAQLKISATALEATGVTKARAWILLAWLGLVWILLAWLGLVCTGLAPKLGSQEARKAGSPEARKQRRTRK